MNLATRLRLSNIVFLVCIGRWSVSSLSAEGWEILAASSSATAAPGESSRQALMRELSEELNLLVTSDRLQFVNSIKYPDWIEDWFTVCIDASLTNLVYQSSEIEAVRWTSLEEAIKINNYNDVNDSTLLTRAQALLF